MTARGQRRSDDGSTNGLNPRAIHRVALDAEVSWCRRGVHVSSGLCRGLPNLAATGENDRARRDAGGGRRSRSSWPPQYSLAFSSSSRSSRSGGTSSSGGRRWSGGGRSSSAETWTLRPFHSAADVTCSRAPRIARAASACARSDCCRGSVGPVMPFGRWRRRRRAQRTRPSSSRTPSHQLPEVLAGSRQRLERSKWRGSSHWPMRRDARMV